MELTKNNSKLICKNIMPILVIGLSSVLLFIRCFFSFTWSDESFYLTIVHRLWLGELMFVDEWHATQLSSLLLLPFYALYQCITGDNEGVYLYFRFLYCLFSGLTAIFTYIQLKKWHQPLASLLCALIYLFYSRANIGGLSYYNITLTLTLLGVLLIYDCLKSNIFKSVKLFFAGIFFALAVVVIPYLAIPYISICFFLILYKRTRKYWKYIFNVMIGTGVSAIIYLGYLLRKMDVSEILFNISYVLNEPELQKTNPIFAIPLIFIRIAWRYKYTILLYFGLFIFVCYKYYKKQPFLPKEIKWIWIINGVIFCVNFCSSASLIGCINIAFILFGLAVIAINKRWKKDFIPVIQSFGVGGAGIVFSFTFSSNTGLDAMAIGFVILAMGMVLILFQTDFVIDNRTMYRTMIIVIVSIIAQTAYLRMVSVYRDAPLKELDTQISSGPAKYLFTTKEHAEQYYDLQEDIATYLREEDKVFYSKNCFWAYLCTDNEYGVPSSWRLAMDSPRLEQYYTLNPEKIPTCIFVLKPEYGKYESSFVQGNEKVDRPNENNLEGYLYDYIMENDYEIIDAKSSLIFRKKMQ